MAEGTSGDGDDALKTLLDMGFDEDKAKKALENCGGSAEQALEVLVEEEKVQSQASANGPKSYRCTDTGEVFRTMRDAQLYAERTGNQNFEEIDPLPPLTEEERKEQMEKLKIKIAEKKAERLKKEKIENREREINRRKQGQLYSEIEEDRQRQQRMREYELQKKEKEADKKRREELKELLAKDKAERAAEDARKKGEDPKAAYDAAYEKYRPKGKQPLSPEEMLAKSINGLKVIFETGGESTLKVLGKILGNIQQNPEEPKFRKLKMSGKTFKKNISKSVSAMKLLKIVGFEKEAQEGEDFFVLKDNNLDNGILGSALSQIESALEEKSLT